MDKNSKMPFLAIVIIILFLFPGCGIFSKTTEVNLTVKNPVPTMQSAFYDVFDKQGPKSFGDIDPNGQIGPRKIEVKKNGNLGVKTQIGGYEVFNQTYPIPSKKTYDLSVTATPRCRTIPEDNETLISTLRKDFSEVGPDIGYVPTSIQSALLTDVGSLCVVTDGQDGIPGKYERIVSPQALGVKVMTVNDMLPYWPPIGRNTTIFTEGKIGGELKTTVPVYFNLNITFNNNSLYEQKFELDNFGRVPKIEDNQRDYLKCFRELPKDYKRQIGYRLAANNRARLVYMNEMFVIKSAKLKVTEGKKTEKAGEVNAMSVVTAKGSYTFNQNEEKNDKFGEIVLNIGGISILHPDDIYNKFQVLDAFVGTKVVDRKLRGASDTFPASTEKVFCFVNLYDIPKKTKVTFVWFYLEKPQPEPFVLSLPAEPFWSASAERTVAGKKGDWRVEIRDVDGNKVKEMKFKVE
jgi:hypothetical protein